MTEKFYQAPDLRPAKPVLPVGESTVADQARAFGVPEEQLQPEVPVQAKSSEPKPPAGLPKSFWQNLGVGR